MLKRIKADPAKCDCGSYYTSVEDPIEAYNYENVGVLCEHCLEKVKTFVDKQLEFFMNQILDNIEGGDNFSDEQIYWAEEYLKDKIKQRELRPLFYLLLA